MLNFVMGGLSLASGLMGSSSAKKQAKAQAKAARAMGKYRKQLKESERQSVLDTMSAETGRAYKSKRRAMATQRAAYGKSGVATSGTPMSVMLEQATEMEIDILNQRRNRLLEAQNLRQQGKTAMYEAEMKAQQAIAEGKAAARSSMMSGLMGAVGGFGAGMTALGKVSPDKNLSFGQKLLY